MAARTLREERVGEPTFCHSIEMLRLADGSYQVVTRYQPDSDPETGSFSPPRRDILTFTNKAEAEFTFRTRLNLLRGNRPPR